jgi:hypothetical protein
LLYKMKSLYYCNVRIPSWNFIARSRRYDNPSPTKGFIMTKFLFKMFILCTQILWSRHTKSCIDGLARIRNPTCRYCCLFFCDSPEKYRCPPHSTQVTSFLVTWSQVGISSHTLADQNELDEGVERGQPLPFLSAYPVTGH